ncbi:hypothetical protein Fmac_017775 [Flemingia macrophylla]|uniref:Uncharacterized protein n=1 Tax=Flemingia macrophylla TaxID=520843 RepID=A0ABD1M347_9FABA
MLAFTDATGNMSADRKAIEMLAITNAIDNTPLPSTYRLNCLKEDLSDEMVIVVRVLRQRLGWLKRMNMVNNYF